MWRRSLLLALFLLFETSVALASSCFFNVSSLHFGNYDSIASTETHGTGSIAVTCEGVSPGIYVIKLGAGPYSGGEFSPRRMQWAGGGSFLNYSLYKDATFSQLWGDGTGGSFVQTGSANETYQIYGIIPSQQNVPAGSYEDSITVTVEF